MENKTPPIFQTDIEILSQDSKWSRQLKNKKKLLRVEEEFIKGK